MTDMKLEVDDPTFMENMYSFEESQEHINKRKHFESLNWRTNRSVVCCVLNTILTSLVFKKKIAVTN